MILTPAQDIIALDEHRFRVICSGRRFGKTVLSTEEIKGKAVYKPSRICYIAPTYQQSRDIAWQMLIKELEPIIVKINESRLELTVRTEDGDKSYIFLRGWESIETLRGQQFDFLVLDEVAMYRNFWLNWQEVLRPTLTDTKGEAMFISTPKGFNHFYDLYNLENEDKDFKSFNFTTYDNPHIPKEEIDTARDQMTEDRFAQEFLADFRKTEGLVYKEFDRQKHLYENEDVVEGSSISVVKTMGGIDFGFTNPCAAITVKKDKYGKYFVSEEWYKTKQTDAQIADYVAALKWNECYPDPESPSGIAELQKRGVNIREVLKGKDSIRNGINVVRELFKQNRLFIHKSCQNLIWELETYSYPEKKNNHNEEENPIKENDHAVDALRYCLSMDTASNSEYAGRQLQRFNITKQNQNINSTK